MKRVLYLFLIVGVIFLYTSFFPTIVFAQWSNDSNVNTPISTAADHQVSPTIVSDGAGGAIITWKDSRGSSSYDIYAQRVNASGAVQWTADGVAISTASDIPSGELASVSDGAGGAIITWRDTRNGIFNSDIYAQRVNASGAVQWQADDVVISNSSGSQYAPTIVSDGAGGAIITWYEHGNADDIYAQRVNATGVVQWQANGVAISTAPDHQWYPAIVSDGAGGAIIMWLDKRSVTGFDIYAQRVNATGAVQWQTNGVGISIAADNHFSPTIVSDGAGGAIITWYDYHSFTGPDIYAQRVNASGVVQWTGSGVEISTAGDEQINPAITSDGAGGAIITWMDRRVGTGLIHKIYAQRVNASGAVQWTANGVPISTANNYHWYPTIVSDGVGGAIITWRDARNSGAGIYAQRVNASGTAEWSTNGVAISKVAFNQLNPIIVSDGAAGAIITWHDFRSDTSYDIYAQNIRADGSLGIPPRSLYGMKFNDANSNGIKDGGETGLENWTITLQPGNLTDVTDKGGNYSFHNLSDGNYTISETQQAGWIQTYPPTGTHSVTITAGKSIGELDFGNFGTNSISGRVYDDANATCTQNAGLVNRIVRLEPGPRFAFTNNTGNYSFTSLGTGAFTISLEPQTYWSQTCPQSPSTYSVNLTTGQNITGKDFGSRLTSLIQDLTVVVSPSYPFPLRGPCCGQEMTYALYYSNHGTVPVSGATLSAVLSDDLVYQSEVASPTLPPPSNVGSNTYVWSLPSPLLPGAQGVIYVTVLVDCQLPASPMLLTTVEIQPTSGDDTPSDNSENYSVRSLCSFDPNDKSVVPRGCGAQGYITATDSLTYEIRFQNLGTAPAYHVVIRDTLDDDLDISTVTPIASSHSNVFEINGRELVWTFWGIELPHASLDEAGSNGFVRFKVKQLSGNPNGTEIENSAGIYFDLNDVVLTNLTLNTITSDPIPVAEFTTIADTFLLGNSIDFTYTGGTTGATYFWDFGSGASAETSDVENPAGISYATPGLKIVFLQTKLGSCTSEPFIKTIYINDTTQIELTVSVNDRWNLISLPLLVDDDKVKSVFHGSTTSAFEFNPLSGYVSNDTLMNGKGYWVKFPLKMNRIIRGRIIENDTFSVSAGWNLIGSHSNTVPVMSISSVPPEMTTSQFFGYEGSYIEQDTIEPGKGYWVKTSTNGMIILSSSLSSNLLLGKIRIVPTDELPPPPPEGDGNGYSNITIIPSEFALEQNYPNPFNPATVINYTLPFESHVVLKIYNLLGQEVETLVDELQDAGFKSLTWDATGFASGMYYYRLQSGYFVETKKLVLIK